MSKPEMGTRRLHRYPTQSHRTRLNGAPTHSRIVWATRLRARIVGPKGTLEVSS
jgi:hypothetical protein